MKKLAAIILLTLSISSCGLVDRFFYDDVVAKVGKVSLYRSDMEDFLPKGISAEDSAHLYTTYINSWATDQLLLAMAEQQLSKSKQDVSRELEAYRRSLLIYRYEKQYVRERIDTLVSEEESELYYKTNISSYQTDVSLIQCRYIKISTDSPNYSRIKTLVRKKDSESLDELDRLCYISAEKYTDYDMNWIPLTEIAQEIKMDLSQCEDELKRNKYILNIDDRIAYIVTLFRKVSPGETAPYEYCRMLIKEAIISKRKQVLIQELEQNLLEDAYHTDKIVIYGNEN